jgi:MFS family permease
LISGYLAGSGARRELRAAPSSPVGAFVGPLLAIALMWWTADNFKAVFWIAVVPAFLSLALILFAVEEPRRPPGIHRIENP